MTCVKLLSASAAVLAAMFLAGCSSTKTPGEIMLTQGEGTAEIGEQWLAGERMVEKGEKLIKKGKSKVDDGQDLVSDGKDMIEDGEDMITEGQALMKDSEAAYRQRGKTRID